MTLWLVRSGRRGEGESYALTNSVVGIGFAEFGDLSKTRSLDAIRQRIEERRPDAKPSTVTNWAGQVDAFVHRIKEGDLVALPLRALRLLHSDVLPADTASYLMRLTR
jgi:predicted Mrr-cat superfamily restriction endonuclease